MLHALRSHFRRAAVLSGLLFTAACGVGDPVAPPAPTVVPSADAGLLSDLGGVLKGTVSRTLGTVNVLTRLPLGILAPPTAHKTIGKAGGVIEMKAHGLRFVVPPGALDRDVKITITALSGSIVAYDFQPHGLQFKKPASFEQNLGLSLVLPGQKLGGGYFKSDGQVDIEGQKAVIDEALKATKKNGWLTFPVRHFSGYLVSCA
jgi:hypothetical protein